LEWHPFSQGVGEEKNSERVGRWREYGDEEEESGDGIGQEMAGNLVVMERMNGIMRHSDGTSSWIYYSPNPHQ